MAILKSLLAFAIPTLFPTKIGASRQQIYPILAVKVGWPTVRFHYAINPLRLGRTILLPGGTRFRPPDRRGAWGWALGSLF